MMQLVTLLKWHRWWAPGTIAPVGPLRPDGAQAVEGHHFLEELWGGKGVSPSPATLQCSIRSPHRPRQVTDQSWNSGSW